MDSIEKFFRAKSVAIIGASTRPKKLGYELLRNVSQYGYKGAIYPINPNAQEILGIKCYPNILSVPGKIDLAVFVLQANLIPTLLEECKQKNVKHIIIVTGGFKETGNQLLEDQVKKFAKKHGIRIIGPNCLGIFDSRSKLDTFFHPHERMIRSAPGPLSFITQSGTFGCAILEMAAESAIGLSKIVSYGNRVDVDEADLIQFLGKDEDTKVISVYLESIGNGRKLLRAFKEVLPKKPIVIMKSGKTDMGARASLSHTGSIAGSYTICEAAFRQAGVIIADRFQELFDIAKCLAMQPLAQGEGVAMVTNGAGLCVTAIDLLTQHGISVGTQNLETNKTLKRKLPSYAIPELVVDLTASGTVEDFEAAMELLLRDPKVDVLIPFFVFQDPTLEEKIIDVLVDLKKYKKPIICGTANGGPYTKKIASILEKKGIPIYPSPERTVAAVRGLIHYGKLRKKLATKRVDQQTNK